MQFFTAFGVPTNLKVGITNLLSNITTRPGSHKGGWARLLKCQLFNLGYNNVTILTNKNSLSEFDVIIFDLGAEYSGALNMFGGLDEKVFKRLNEIKDFKGSIYSWRNQLPDLSVLESRRTNASTCGGFRSTEQSFLPQVQETLSKCNIFDHAYATSSLLIGDSHTPGVWTPEFMIERRDGRTLSGMIENSTVEKYLGKFSEIGLKITELHIHCSSIDIRHHVGRSFNKSQESHVMACDLVDGVRQLDIDPTHITYNETMGIEDESRDLPKTGYFKGTPFFGSWEERNSFRVVFNDTIKNAARFDNSSVLEYPKYFFDESGKLRFDVMEVPGSVHISPEHYRWDLDKNQLRWTEAHDVSRQAHYGTVMMLGKIEKDMYGS